MKINRKKIAALLIAGGISSTGSIFASADMLNVSPGQKVELTSTVRAYVNSELASENAQTGYRLYEASEYFVYKVTDGAVNISRNPGVPGGWVLNSQIVIPESSLDNNPTETGNTGDNNDNKDTENTIPDTDKTVTVTSIVRVYSNAASAEAQNGYYVNYGPATYYVYKTYGNAINISRTPGTPGGWISMDVIGNTDSTEDTTVTPPENSVPDDKNESPVSKAETVLLKAPVKAYITADSAISGGSTYVSYGPSTYYIYKTTDGATNISRTPGIPGAWVSNENLKDAESGITSPETDVPSSVLSSKENMMKEAGISESDWKYVDYIVTRESNWNPTISNPYSGAYGLPQALPGNKMATAGSDWATNPVTQLKWMDSYVKSRYGGWKNAYDFWLQNHWY